MSVDKAPKGQDAPELTDQQKRDHKHIETVVQWLLPKAPKMRMDEPQAFKAACIRMGAEGMLNYAQARAEQAAAEVAKTDVMAAGFAEYERRLEQAEAEVARLRDVLGDIADADDPYEPCGWAINTARAALREGGKDTAARCAECDCENGGTDCNWIKSDTAQKGDE
jgi:hypothetical protein